MLEVGIDDAGRWQLSLHKADYYSEQGAREEAPPVWSLRLLVNLTRLFARLPGRTADSADVFGDAVGDGAA